MCLYAQFSGLPCDHSHKNCSHHLEQELVTMLDTVSLWVLAMAMLICWPVLTPLFSNYRTDYYDIYSAHRVVLLTSVTLTWYKVEMFVY